MNFCDFLLQNSELRQCSTGQGFMSRRITAYNVGTGLTFLPFFIMAHYVLIVAVYCRDLDLKRPMYQKTACYGHFGRDEFSWEQPKILKF